MLIDSRANGLNFEMSMGSRITYGENPSMSTIVIFVILIGIAVKTLDIISTYILINLPPKEVMINGQWWLMTPYEGNPFMRFWLTIHPVYGQAIGLSLSFFGTVIPYILFKVVMDRIKVAPMVQYVCVGVVGFTIVCLGFVVLNNFMIMYQYFRG